MTFLDSLTTEQKTQLIKEAQEKVKDDAAEQERKNAEFAVAYEGTRITLPAVPDKMAIPTAMKVLEKAHKADTEEINVSEIIDIFPWDGAVQFARALQIRYGWAEHKEERSFFGEKLPANMKPVPIDIDKTEQVYWGRYEVSAIKAVLACSAAHKFGKFMFMIQGTLKRKFLPEFMEIAQLTRQLCKAHSIYKGKAVRVRTAGADLDASEPFEFLDTREDLGADLVFAKDTQKLIEANLHAPIRYTKECKELGIPIKRGVLLEGPYGTGKTQLAYATARMCRDSQATFLMLDSVEALAAGIELAKSYQPAIVFAEDIDRVVTGKRTVTMDAILNIIDGINSKTTDVIVVLTTNHVEDINPAMVRPGRLDAVISLGYPDAEAAARLVEVYGRGKLATKFDKKKVGKALVGQIPAMIREVVERAKLYALSRAGNTSFKLTADDIVQSALGMRRHAELLAVQKPQKSPGDELAEGLSKVLKANGLGKMEADLAGINENVMDIKNEIGA